MADNVNSLDFFRATRAEPLQPEGWQDRLAGLDVEARQDWQWEAQRYVADPFVVEAVNVAIALGKPLLVTGDPGVGKTALANAVAWQLGLARPEKFVAKSTSEARDLFYRYDALARFYAIEVSRHLRSADGLSSTAATIETDQSRRFMEPENPRHFIEFSGLGRAILSAHDRTRVSEFLLDGNRDGGSYVHPGESAKSVVLIDEIDKASSDFCNDLLDEFDRLQFGVPEIRTALTPELDGAMRPIVIITSNRERELPPAFLRRCVYAHIEQPKWSDTGERAAPDAYRMENILRLRLPEAAVYSPFTLSVLQLVEAIARRQPGKVPSTAEIIELVRYCEMRDVDWQRPIGDQGELHDYAVIVLSKTETDNGIARKALESVAARGEG